MLLGSITARERPLKKKGDKEAHIYLVALASRAALIKGNNVCSGSAFWKNGCWGNAQKINIAILNARIDIPVAAQQRQAAYPY
jgi:hypothetical protein